MDFKEMDRSGAGNRYALVLQHYLRGHNTLSVGVAKNLAHQLYESNDGT